MSRIKVMIGVLSAAALVVCALGASSASALTMEECNAPAGPETGVACNGGFWKGATGAIRATGGESTLFSTVGGVEFEIVCKKLTGTGTSENVESGGQMHIKGTNIVVSYEECAVTKPAGGKCTVPSTITTNNLKATTVSGTMGQKYEPTEGSTFVSIAVGGAECPVALKGTKNVTGTATATSNAAQEEAGEQVFNIVSGEPEFGELKYAGQNATFKSSNTFETANNTIRVFPRTP